MSLRSSLSVVTFAVAAVGVTLALATPSDAAAAVTPAGPAQFSFGASNPSARPTGPGAGLPFEFEDQPWIR